MSTSEEAPRAAPIGPGALIGGKYRVDEQIGAGAMGIVVAATHTELDQRVAIKMMRDEDVKNPDARARFAREARAAVRLKSQHAARVIDVGALDGGAPYLVMELLEGMDLGAMLEQDEPMPIDQAVAFVLQVCEAVAEAHGLGIVHRDLKPRNVFVTTGVDGKPLLKVLDFGISKVVRREGDAGATVDLGLTKTSEVMGSPAYMAPEQLVAARDADARSDIWSLGVILYETIAGGRLPWEARTVTELGAMILRDPPRPLRERRPDVPEALEAIVARCLEKEAGRRYASVEELAHALEPFASGLATGAAARVSSVARASRRPSVARTARESAPEKRASSSRRMASGGTFVSWGETEPLAVQGSVPPPPPIAPSRSPKLLPLVVVAVALATGAAWSLVTRHGGSGASASSPLPDDRRAVRPPEPSGSNEVSPPLPPVVDLPAPPPTGAPAASGASTLAAIPRRAPAASAPGAVTAGAAVVSGGAPASAPAAATGANVTATAKPADPHEIRAIGRK